MNDNLQKRGNRVIALTNGGAFLGSLIGGIPGGVVLGVIVAVYAWMSYEPE